MSRHYSSSAPVKWLRNKLNIDKPYALPWGGFEKWEAELKAKRPLAYFLTETLPDMLEYPAKWTVDPFNEVRYYFRNRFVTKTHYIATGLAPGKWYEFDSRVLHGLFTELVDFVEIEKAGHMVAWSHKAETEKYNMPWWKEHWFSNWAEWRCAEAGLDHLRWEISLDDPAKDLHERCDSQAQAARETMILYTWWKEIRSVRTDNAAYEDSGWDDFNVRMDAKYGDDWMWGGASGAGRNSKLTLAEQKEYEVIRDAIDQLEKDWDQEDEDMMIRLIKLRKSLWT
jgi:hypothetical protein